MKFNKLIGVLVLIISITWGCNTAADDSKASGTKQNTKSDQIKVQQSQTPKTKAVSGVDQYGRSPGDPHYGHNHGVGEGHGTPQLNTSPQAAPTDGGPDKYGRMPGDAHYGHNHE